MKAPTPKKSSKPTQIADAMANGQGGQRCSGMKRLTILALMAFCAAAQAAAPTCLPMLNGAGYPLAPRWESAGLGKHLVLMCTDATQSQAFAGGLSCLHADCNVNTFGAAMLKVLRADDKQAALDTEWDKAVKWTCDAPPDGAKAALCTERAALIKAGWPTWSAGYAAAVWRVKANGTATTRPAYSLINEVLGTKEVARAPVGAICNVSRPTAPATNGDLRAEFGPANVAGVVTICAKAAP